MREVLRCIVPLAALLTACGGDVDNPWDARDTGRDDGRDHGDGDSGCDARACFASCVADGYLGGTCTGGACECTGAADGDADGELDGDTAPLCEPGPCNDSCVIGGFTGGHCELDSCVCNGAGDADADGDARTDADGDADDGGGREDGDLDGGTCTVPDFPQQLQCRSGWKCTIATVSAGAAVPVCDLDGTGGNNDSCDDAPAPATTDTCGRFYYCLSTSSGHRCLRFCSTSDDCAAAHGTTASGCLFTMGDGTGGTLPGVRFCTAGCDRLADTGCNAGQTCRPEGNSTGLWSDCSTVGSGTQGASCALGGDSACAARYVCLGSGSAARCNRFCAADGDCAALGATSQCVFHVVDGTGATIPGFQVCSDQCDVFADTVCSARSEACRLGTYTGHTGAASYCEEIGAGGQNALCPGGSSDCQTGYDCYTVTGYGAICLLYCRYPSGTPSCTGAATCQPAGTGFPAAVGVCVPPPI
jgi:hypothetical protein